MWIILPVQLVSVTVQLCKVNQPIIFAKNKDGDFG
jgi:hypothetical protein